MIDWFMIDSRMIHDWFMRDAGGTHAGHQPGHQPGHGGATARRSRRRSRGGHGPGSEARNQGGLAHSFARTSRTTRTRNTISR